MTNRMTPLTLAKLRLAAQLIRPTSTSPTRGPVDVVRWLTALQSQDLPGALWAIGLRSPGIGRSEVVAAFNSGELVRSCPLRGTLHVTAAEDLGWILSLTAERMRAAQSARHRQLEISAADIDLVRGLALELLAQLGGRVTREDFFAACEQVGQGTMAQRGYHLLFLLCLEGTLVQGPVNGASTGTTQFYVSSKDWIKKPRILGKEEALGELALRYFRSHGPATIKDFQWWAKLTLKDIKLGLDRAQDSLESLESDGERYWLAPETAELLGGTVSGARSVLLLPGFDEYVLGYTDRSAALAPDYAPRIVPGNNGMFKATIVAGGRVVGTWRKAQGAAERERQLADVVLPEFFEDLPPNQYKALETSARKYATFLTA